MVHVIKIYFTGPQQNVQIRRVAVNSDVVSRFGLLENKIEELFPDFAIGPIEVTWKDSENDIIHVSSDEELAQALASADDGVLRIYANSIVKQQQKVSEKQTPKSSSNEIHQNVMCDGCDKTIQGYRYKCLQCRNFDLCSSCNAENMHANHDMIKLVRPTHIPREWVFLGARKLWKSLFGRCPSSYFTASNSANQNGQATKSDTPKNQWAGIFDDLLKGGYVSADKLIKDNLGNFLNFVESVSGNLDVKLENSAPKPSPTSENQDNKTDQKVNNDSPDVQPTSTDASPLSSGEPMTPKPAEKLSHSASLGVAEKQKDNLAKPCGLFCNEDIDRQIKEYLEEAEAEEESKINEDAQKQSEAAFEILKEQKEGETSVKPVVLNDFSDEWTILNKQEDEKKDTTSGQDNGAKPKYPSIYPYFYEKLHACENTLPKANVETKLKEVYPVQKDNAQVLPKPAVDANSGIYKNANINQNENSTPCFNPEIMNALLKMQSMGFTNEGGWLERLLITKDGNINATLDSLYPNTRMVQGNRGSW